MVTDTIILLKPLKSSLNFYIYTFVVSRAFMAGAASQAGDAVSSRAPGLTSGLQGSMNVHRCALLLVPQWQCISSLVFYIIDKIWSSIGSRISFKRNGLRYFGGISCMQHFTHKACAVASLIPTNKIGCSCFQISLS